MPRTFYDQLAADAQDCFLNTGEFAGEHELWPGGDRNQAISVALIWDADQEQGENAGLLHKMTADSAGRNAHRYIRVELLATITVNEDDRFRYVNPNTGEVQIGQAVRRIESDPGMQTWLVTVPRGIDSKHTRVRR